MILSASQWTAKSSKVPSTADGRAVSDGITPLLPRGLGERPVPREFRAQTGEQSSDSRSGGYSAEDDFCATVYF